MRPRAYLEPDAKRARICYRELSGVRCAKCQDLLQRAYLEPDAKRAGVEGETFSGTRREKGQASKMRARVWSQIRKGPGFRREGPGARLPARAHPFAPFALSKLIPDTQGSAKNFQNLEKTLEAIVKRDVY